MACNLRRSEILKSLLTGIARARKPEKIKIEMDKFKKCDNKSQLSVEEED